MRAWSCITSYPLRGLPYLAYDNVNPAVVNSMMLCSSTTNQHLVTHAVVEYCICMTGKYVQWCFDGVF